MTKAFVIAFIRYFWFSASTASLHTGLCFTYTLVAVLTKDHYLPQLELCLSAVLLAVLLGYTYDLDIYLISPTLSK